MIPSYEGVFFVKNKLIIKVAYPSGLGQSRREFFSINMIPNIPIDHICIHVPFRAVPKARPRFKSHAYTPTRTRDFEKKLKKYLKTQFLIPPIKKEVYLSIIFYFNKKSTADIDNLAKAVMDAAQGVLFENDRQVHGLYVEKKPAENDNFNIYMGWGKGSS